MSTLKPPPVVLQAMGQVILYVLSHGENPDLGMTLTAANISVGEIPCDIPVGNWTITVQRIAKPSIKGDSNP